MQRDKVIAVQTLKEAATEGYRQGFDEGYAAARQVVKMVMVAWLKEPLHYDLEGALQALDMSRDKAEEMLGTPEYTVTACSASSEVGRWQ